MRRGFLKLMLMAGVSAMPIPAVARQRFKPLTDEILDLVKMRASPFPYHGDNPETGEVFLNVRDGRRRGHASPRGGTYWEDEAYSDQRTLCYLPRGFNLGKPAALVVYFHGNNATLARDVVERQQIPAQLAESRINAALVVPQFAFDARDSSPGNFWRQGYFSSWLAEAGGKLAKLHGQGAKPADFDKLPVILVAYSGGYFAAAWCLKLGGAVRRIAGLVLMDALYGDTEKFAGWIAARHQSAFVFSAYSKSSRKWNVELQEMLKGQGIGFHRGFPDALAPGRRFFGEMAGDIDHAEFMSRAWTVDPLRWTLERVAAFRG